MGNPFEIVNALTAPSNKSLITKEFIDDNYVPFIINRHFSLFNDLVFFANELNMGHNSSSAVDMQFDFYDNVLKVKKKRFAKWIKPSKDHDEILEMIMQKYEYSRAKAIQVFRLFDEEQIALLKSEMYKGGRKGGNK